MRRAALVALALLAAPVPALCDTAAVTAGTAAAGSPGAECQSCTARHRSLQTLQRARTDGECPEDAAAPCTPAARGPQGPDDGAVLRMPDGQLVGVRD